MGSTVGFTQLGFAAETDAHLIPGKSRRHRIRQAKETRFYHDLPLFRCAKPAITDRIALMANLGS